jgi:hypothetical protein
MKSEIVQKAILNGAAHLDCIRVLLTPTQIY